MRDGLATGEQSDTFATMTLFLADIGLNATALMLLVFGVLFAMSVLFSHLFERAGVPIVLLFLILGMLGGSEGLGGIAFDDYGFAARIGTIALILILFDGGLNTSIKSFRAVIGPSSILATLGVALTAILLALAGRLLGLGWGEAMLLGSIVSSTDAAAVFAVLRGGRLALKQRVGRTLEVESCINDPMAVILTLAVTDVLAGSETTINWWPLLWDVPIQLGVGTILGIGVGIGGRWLLGEMRLGTVGLIPAFTLSLAFISYSLATLAFGSGFMAVFLTALVLGNSPLGYRAGLARVHDALAWLSQMAMFLMMGLLVYPSKLVGVAGLGLGLAVILAVVARPIAVVLCLLPFRYPTKEVVYLSWIGLRGAVPIILGMFPVLAGVEGGEDIFHLVFFIVVASTIIPGATVRWATRRLKLGEAQRKAPEAVLEINSASSLSGQIESFEITPAVAVCSASLSEIDFPEKASVILIVRGREILAAKGNTQLLPGDHAYVFFRPEDRPFIELLFGAPEL